MEDELQVKVSVDEIVNRKLDSKGRASLKEFAEPRQKITLAVIEYQTMEE